MKFQPVIFILTLAVLGAFAEPGAHYTLTGKELGIEEIIKADMAMFPALYAGEPFDQYLIKFRSENKIGWEKIKPGDELYFPVTMASLKPGLAVGEQQKIPEIRSHSRGLHGYIGYSATRPPARSEFSAGMGFYSAVWPLIDEPIANFQIGLAGSWVTPDNSDNKDKPLAPEGTRARNWPERGPTWGSVFQTLEGGLGYWAGNRFRYGPPKFSMNATPQCYDYEIGSPGWSFFYNTKALPDDRLGIAQLSNRLLIPPDALPFAGNPNGKFLGYAYMALPFTDPTTGDPPTGDQAWTCFLSTANFKGPMAYYIPETWSKVGKLFNYPFIYGRGLDARPGNMGGGAMEINTVPCFESTDGRGVTYSKIPKLQFPVDAQGRTFLVQDVTYYSKAALYDSFKAWREGGAAPSGCFDEKGEWKSSLTTRTTRYDQGGKAIVGVERVFDTKVYPDDVWGLEWSGKSISPRGVFPQYFKHVGEKRVAVAAADVPEDTGLLSKQFQLAKRGRPFTSPGVGAWSTPGPRLGPFSVTLIDGSTVTYSWYRFVDQPSFQQYQWSAAKKDKLQSFVEKIHAHWSIDQEYMAPPTRGELVSLDPALFVTPPKGLEVGYVPIVTRQEDGTPRRILEADLDALSGTYQRDPVENDWHVGNISVEERNERGQPTVLRWKNRAGRSWRLFPDMEAGGLCTGEENPYYASGTEEGRYFIFECERTIPKGSLPPVSGFWFQNQLYVKMAEID